MSVSDAEYATWLASDAQERCLLVEMSYYAGGVQTAYLSSAPFVSGPGDTPANTAYQCVIKSIPTFNQKMSDVLYGRTTASLGNVIIDNGDGAFDDWLYYNFAGRPLTMYLGAPSWERADFRAVWTGVLSNITVQGTNSLSIEARSREHLLSQEVTMTKITTGTADGRYQPLCYGLCYNITPLCVDATNRIYRVNAADVKSIDEVRCNGVDIGAANWTNNADGTFTIDANYNNGQITCDVKGMKTGSTLMEHIKEIVKDLVVTRSAVFAEADFDTTYWTNLNTTFPQHLGLYITQPVQLYQLLDQICGSVGAFYGVDRDGKIYIRQFALSGTATHTVTAEDIAAHGINVAKVYQPMDKLKRGYQKNWTVQSNIDAGFDTSWPAGGWFYIGGVLQTDTQYRPATSAADRHLYSEEYLYTISEITRTNILKAVDPAIQGTLLTLKTDSSTEGTRWLTMWGAVRVQFSIDCFTKTARVNLGDRVTVTHPRFGLDAGVTGTVVAIQDRPTKHRQLLEVIV